ncbi:aspartyl-phosphate phosphatase Spo0E family protein [Brevibacillus migulae]|uniref:aspartyl-phosphate phosphatase Spo0E family protein n=1 Tax=Brevibacillus migulae TaxID=1644114 RepID=UPI00106DD7F1|nr:aspartyl-phosphate phosphatase Spo0E family protein [Brevibacillus migulae]
MRLADQVKALLEQIERKKQELLELANRRFSPLDAGCVLEKSQELDLLIVEYQKMIMKK